MGMKKVLRLVFLMWMVAGRLPGQSPQFSQFYGNPIFTNPALAGDTGTPRFIANYRNQWARLGEPFQTTAFSFDTYAEDAGVGLGFQAMHDQQSSVLKSTGLSGQVSKMAYLDGQKEVRLIGGLQTAWTSYRWNGDNLTSVADFLGIQDPLSVAQASYNRFTFSSGALLEFVPRYEYDVSYWLGGAWHNIGVTRNDWMGHQRFNAQIGAKIPFDMPLFFGNSLGSDLNRETALSTALQFRSQGASRQVDAGFNVICSPLLLGVWYRGLAMGRMRRDALIGTAGLAYGNWLFQASYDMTVSSLGPDTGAFEISVWYGLDYLFQFSGKAAQSRRSRKCMRF